MNVFRIVVVFSLIWICQSTNVFRFEAIVMLEEPPIGHLVVDLAHKLEINDLATSDYKFRFYSPHSITSHYFIIDQLTGHVKTQRSIDREYLCENRVCGPCTSTSNCSLPIEIVATQTKSTNTKIQKFVSFDVVIEDKNEFAPKFPNDVIVLNVSEAAPVNFSIPLPAAVDRDSHQTQIAYAIVPIDQKSARYNQELEALNSKLRLSVDESSTQPQLNLVILEPFDYEEVREVRFKIEASDGPHDQKTLTGNCLVILKIIDINDNLPIFDQSQYEYRLDEDKAVDGTRLIRVHAEDKDDALNGLVNYSLMDSSDKFFIDPSTGWISLASHLDYEDTPVHRLIVKAQDSGLTNSMPVYTNCIIYLNDINDNFPQINLTFPNTIDDFNTNLKLNSNNEVELSEWTMPNTFIAQILVTDLDSGLNGKVNLAIKEYRRQTEELNEYQDYVSEYEESNDFGLVHLFNDIYSLMLKQNLDREIYDAYLINITASDFGQPSLHTNLMLRIKIKDENDNKPKFVPLNNHTTKIDNSTKKVVSYEFVLDELINPSDRWVQVGKVKAIDKDLEQNVTFSIEQSSDSFKIDPSTGVIEAKANLMDRELKDSFHFQVVASDGLNLESVNIFIKLNDLNDNQPRFEKNIYKFQILENKIPFDDEILGKVKAHDFDQKGSNFSVVRYAFVNENDYFRVDQVTGDLYQIKELDYEIIKMLDLEIVAYDNFNQTPSLNSTCLVRIDVIDLNDNQPIVLRPLDNEMPFVFKLNSILNDSFIENNRLVSRLTKIVAKDADSGLNSILRFKIEKQIKLKVDKNLDFFEQNVNLFGIDSKTGSVYSKFDLSPSKQNVESNLVGSFRLRNDKFEIDPNISGFYGLVLNISDSAESFTKSVKHYVFIVLVNRSADFEQKISLLKSIINQSRLNGQDFFDYDYGFEQDIEDGKFYSVVSQFEDGKVYQKRPKAVSHYRKISNKNSLRKLFGFIDMGKTKTINYILILIISVLVFTLVLITSLCLFSIYYKKAERQKSLNNSAKKHLCEIYTDSKKTTLAKSSASPSSLTSSEFLNLNSNRNSTDDEDETGGFRKPSFMSKEMIREEEQAILIVNTSSDENSNLASSSSNSTKSTNSGKNNQLLVLISSSDKKSSNESLASTTISSKVSTNFRTFKNSGSSSNSPKQTILLASDVNNSYRTLPVSRNLKSKNVDAAVKQLNLPVNELFKRYELKKQATNGTLETSGSISSLNSLSMNRKFRAHEASYASPKIVQKNFNLNPTVNITTNESNEVPDYFFKDEKEHKVFQLNGNAKNRKILNLKQIVVDSNTSSVCNKTDL
ncbi:protocadherin-9 isoform X2 [Brachionus plicatilis]|uniref:Protocadherin-9 isoform X2 n=1 Tax=Brachionus plicatilis TaxID=10195 RepID=A0A3M7Q6E2_BRAPC|nr:protocadherin-9 isoform X2 [Brachionus plicatilis]